MPLNRLRPAVQLVLLLLIALHCLGLRIDMVQFHPNEHVWSESEVGTNDLIAKQGDSLKAASGLFNNNLMVLVVVARPWHEDNVRLKVVSIPFKVSENRRPLMVHGEDGEVMGDCIGFTVQATDSTAKFLLIGIRFIAISQCQDAHMNAFHATELRQRGTAAKLYVVRMRSDGK